MASTLTGNDVGDPSQVAPLLDQMVATIASVTADGAYDGMPTYDVVAAHGEDVRVIIPPHVTAVLSADTRPSSVLAYERVFSLVSRPKRLSAWPSSTAC
jgi:transposase